MDRKSSNRIPILFCRFHKTEQTQQTEQTKAVSSPIATGNDSCTANIYRIDIRRSLEHAKREYEEKKEKREKININPYC